MRDEQLTRSGDLLPRLVRGYHRLMRAAWLTFALLMACDKAGPAAPDLGSPAAAARCQVAAIEAQSTERWAACWHPAVRGSVKVEMSRKTLRADFWVRAKQTSAPLASATDAQFTMHPMPADQASLGDLRASFRLERDGFEVVRKDGQWYIVDSGI